MAAAEEVVQDKVTSVREDLQAAFKQHAEPEAPEASEVEEKQRARDESGRFTKEAKPNEAGDERRADNRTGEGANKEGARPHIGATPEGNNLQPASVPPDSAPATQPAAQKPATDLAPHGWSLAAKGKWNELPADIRAEISKREADIHRGMTRMDEERQFARSMYQAVQPYEAMFRADGASAPQAVSNVLNIAYVLRTGDPATKAQTPANVARQFNVDLNLLQPSQQGSTDPTITALQQTVGELRQQLQQQSQFQQRSQQDAETRRQQEVQASIQTFAQETDALGQLKHPHFNAVEPIMAAYVQGGITRDLEEAYQMAVNARPDIRAQLQADENAKRAAEAEKQRKAEEARRKGRSIRGGVGGYTPPAPNPNASVREDLEAAFADARGRI